jgi:CRP/FNR family transcriptional regulator
MAAADSALLLRKCTLWEDLTEEEYHELDVLDNYKEVRKGEYVYFEAFNHNTIYFIKKGHILLGSIDDSGAVITKDILKPGDFFGQFVLEKNNLDGEFAQAIKADISLCSFSTESFIRLLHKNPKISIRYTKLVGLRLKKFQNRFINVIQKDVRARLLLFLRDLLADQRNKAVLDHDTAVVPNYLTHDEIAQLIGSSRQTVTTLLNQLKDEGIFEYARKELMFRQVSSHFAGIY